MRKIKFETGKVYHVYNRGAGRQDIFIDDKDYLKFLWQTREFNNKSGYNERQFIKNREKLGCRVKPGVKALTPGLTYPSFNNFLNTSTKSVETICYNLLSNHYHFILKQISDGGIRNFMHKLGTGYVKYFNHRHNRSGVLFERRFEAFPINNDIKLCQISAYVNCNYEIHKIGKAKNWEFSSYQDYLGLRNGSLINKKIILNLFNNNIDEYKIFCQRMVIEFQKNKEAEK